MQLLRIATMVGALLLGTVSQSVGQDISSALGRLPPGTVIVWKNSEGLFFVHTVMGKDAKGYRLEYNEGRTPKKAGRAEYWVDAKGQIIHFTWPDGREARYSPHNCVRTLGDCSYTETRSNGEVFERSVFTEATADGFKFTEMDRTDGRVTKRGETVLDSNGLNTTNWYQATGEKKISLRIVSITPPK